MSLRKPLLAFTGVAAMSAFAFAPMVTSATDGLDGKAQAAAAGALIAAETADVQQFQALPCTAEMAGPFQCNNVDLVDHVPTAMFGGAGHGSDSWGWTDDDGTEYAIVTSGDGHGFFRITDEGASYLGTLRRSYVDKNGTPVLWNDVKVVNDHAYITAEDDDGDGAYGIQIVDMEKVAQLGPVSEANGLRYITEDGWVDEGLAGHNLVAFPERGVLGIVLGEHEECGGNLVFFDVETDPTNPVEIGCGWPENDPGYVDTPHDAHCVVYQGPDPDYNGEKDPAGPRDVCALFSQYDGGMLLVDVTAITRDGTSDRATFVNRFDYATRNYTHQGWFSPNHRWVLFNDELDESGALALGLGGSGATNVNGNNRQTTTYYVDVSDLDVAGPGVPSAPQYNADKVKKWSNPNTVAIDHNMYPVAVEGGEPGEFLLYQANYGAGLRVLKATDESLANGDGFEEVAYFDTYPGPGPAEFYGAWNTYPFLESGKIIVSDFQAGLLVLDVDEDALD